MLLQTAQNKLLVFFIKDMNQSKPIYIASIPNRGTQHQPKNNLHSINPITVHTASDFLLVGFLSPKTYTLQHPIPHCHSARSRRRSRRIHHPKNKPRPPGEGGPSQTVGEGRGKTLSHTPHPPTCTFSLGKR